MIQIGALQSCLQSAQISYKCPFCPLFITPTLNLWLGHIRLVHQCDPRIPCCIDECKETFCKYSSLKSHVYRRHYDHISGCFSVSNELNVNEASITIEERLTGKREDINNVICDDHEHLHIECESDHTEIDEEEDSGQLPSNCQSMASSVANISPNSTMDRNVALYLLKLKEVHHLSQSAIDCVVAQTKSLLQQQMSLLRESVNMELQQVSTQDDIQKITDNAFQDMNNPFEYLSSAYMQEKYFREILQLVVSNTD